MSLQATALLAGLFALLMVPLSLQVSVRRMKTGVAAFDGGSDETLRRSIRAHGNFIEYAPMALISVGLIEFAGAAKLLVWSLAAAFLLSRILHAIGMQYTSTATLRAISMLIQHAAFLIAGAWLVVQVFRGAV